MIQSYFHLIHDWIHSFSSSNFVVNASIHTEIRPGQQGYISGSILFIDKSTLFFAEYLDTDQGILQKLMYRYHYQDADYQMIFRYDNARHRSTLPSSEHKHTPNTVVYAPTPTIKEVLEEIILIQGWL